MLDIMMKQNEEVLPEGIRGWSWGAFLLNVIWAVFNKTWLGLLCFVPVVGVAMPFVLGFKGREWAWKNDTWDSVEHFNQVQRNWSKWGIIVTLGSVLLGTVGAVASIYFFNTIQTTDAELTTTTATPVPSKEEPLALTTPPITDVSAPPVANNDFSGKWSTDIMGDVTIEQINNKVIGNYQYDDEDNVTQLGKFDAVIEGKSIKGDWHERPNKGKGDNSHGDFELVLSGDATTLKGWYRNEGEKEKEDWILVRK
jgi:hypothetical protein